MEFTDDEKRILKNALLLLEEKMDEERMLLQKIMQFSGSAYMVAHNAILAQQTQSESLRKRFG